MKYVLTFAGGVLVTLLICFVGVPIYQEVTRDGWKRAVEVHKSTMTGAYSVFVHSNPVRVSLREGDVPSVKTEWIHEPKSAGEFIVDVGLTQNTTIYGVFLDRREGTWDGTSFVDDQGQKWQVIHREDESAKFFEEHRDLTLHQRVWFGAVSTDGKNVYFSQTGSDNSRDPPCSIWQLVR